MEIQINIADTHEVTSRGKVVTVDLTKLSDEIVAKLVLHGLTQKVADAAAGALGAAMPDYDNATKAERKAWAEANADVIAEHAVEQMQAVADRLQSGEWGVERGNGGAGLTSEQTAIIAVADELLKPAQWKAKIKDWDTMTTAERKAAKWGLLENNPKIEALRAEAQRRAANKLAL